MKHATVLTGRLNGGNAEDPMEKRWKSVSRIPMDRLTSRYDSTTMGPCTLEDGKKGDGMALGFSIVEKGIYECGIITRGHCMVRG